MLPVPPTVDELQRSNCLHCLYDFGSSLGKLTRRQTLNGSKSDAANRMARRCISDSGDLGLVRHEPDELPTLTANHLGGESRGL